MNFFSDFADWAKRATDIASGMDREQDLGFDYENTKSRIKKTASDMENHWGNSPAWGRMSDDMKTGTALAVDAAGGIGESGDLWSSITDWDSDPNTSGRVQKQQQVADKAATMVGKKPESDDLSEHYAGLTWNISNDMYSGHEKGKDRARALKPAYTGPNSTAAASTEQQGDNKTITGDPLPDLQPFTTGGQERHESQINDPKTTQSNILSVAQLTDIPTSSDKKITPTQPYTDNIYVHDELITAPESQWEETRSTLRHTKEKTAPGQDWSQEHHDYQEATIKATTEQASKELTILENRIQQKEDIKLPEEYIAFDGQKMTHIRNNNVLRAWPSVSGREGHQRGADQKIENAGPLPEGRWMLKQEDHQNWNDLDSTDKLLGYIPPIFDMKFGPWPGATLAWGENRIWIAGPNGESKPAKYGRSGFSIHGGSTPGSAGCIDATEYMADFTAWFKQRGQDLPLFVSYPKE